MARVPGVSSFLIADQVFQQASGKWCVIGIFDRINVAAFPAIHHSLGLFVNLSDAQGTYDVKIQFCDSKDQTLAEFKDMRLEVKSVQSPATFGLQTMALPLPAPGRYFFKLYLNHDLLKDIPIDVEPLKIK